MNDLFIGGAVSLGSGGVAFLILWGYTKRLVQEHSVQISKLEAEHEKLLDLVHSLRDVYVSYQHFNEIMNSIRETQRDLKEDMKKIIELLSVRA